MSERRAQLVELLEDYYRSCGWTVDRAADGTVRAAGTGGVEWIGLAVVEEDVREPEFRDRLLELADQRMPAGQRCPFELLPDDRCEEDVRRMLAELRLHERVSVYSLAA